MPFSKGVLTRYLDEQDKAELLQFDIQEFSVTKDLIIKQLDVLEKKLETLSQKRKCIIIFRLDTVSWMVAHIIQGINMYLRKEEKKLSETQTK